MSSLDQYLSMAEPCTLSDIISILRTYDETITKEIEDYNFLLKQFKERNVELSSEEESMDEQVKVADMPSNFKVELPVNFTDLEEYKYKLLTREPVQKLATLFNFTNEYFVLESLDRQAPLHHYIVENKIELHAEMQIEVSQFKLPRLEIVNQLIKVYDLKTITSVFYKALQHTELQKNVDELQLPYSLTFEIIFSIITQSHTLLPKYKHAYESMMDFVQLDRYCESLDYFHFFKQNRLLLKLNKVDITCISTEELENEHESVVTFLSWFSNHPDLFLSIEEKSIELVKINIKENQHSPILETLKRCLFIYSRLDDALQTLYEDILSNVIQLVLPIKEIKFLFDIYELLLPTTLEYITVQIRDALLLLINVHVKSILNPQSSSKFFVYAKQQDWTTYTPDLIASIHQLLKSVSHKDLLKLYAREFEENLEIIWINRIYDALRKGLLHHFVCTQKQQLMRYHVELLYGFLMEYLHENVFTLLLIHLNIIDIAFTKDTYNLNDFKHYKELDDKDIKQLVQLVFELK